MSESLDQDPNKVVATLSRIHRSPSMPWVRLFTVSIQNTVDDVRNYTNNNSDDIPNYYETEDLESVLRQARDYLHDIFCQKLKHVTVKMEKEE